MGIEMRSGAVNQVPKGTLLFSESEPVAYVCVIVKGKIVSQNEMLKLPLGSGSFIGACDLFVGHYLSDYVAEEDSMLYVFSAKNKEDLRTLLETNDKDYRGLMVNSLTKYFFELSKINKEYHAVAKSLYQSLSHGYMQYIGFCKKGGVAEGSLPDLLDMTEYKTEIPDNQAKLAYYEELAKVPANVQKSFFGCGMELTLFHIVELSSYIINTILDISETGTYINEYFSILYNDGEQNLLFFAIKLAYVLQKSGRAPAELQKLVDQLLDSFNQIEATLHLYMGKAPAVNRERLEKLYFALLSNTELETQEEDGAVDDEEIIRQLKNSAKRILGYSGLGPDKLKDFSDAVNLFIQSKDRFSTEDASRKLRKQISEGFYKLYRAVFLESLEDTELTKPIELFLNFGFFDERLLTREQQIQLYRLNVHTSQHYYCNVFTIPEWLEAVYTGKREPSKNEFDLEYAEMLRELKKSKEITPEEEQKRLANRNLRLDYEIQNMFRYNHRIVNGQPSIFVPILCNEQMLTMPDSSAVTKDRMGQLIAKYRTIDYSVFYRELMYSDAHARIEKEYEMKEAVPDIILLPTCGQNAVMWQEISCKRRDSAGRFLFPILAEGNLDDLLIRTLGRFRWELCRTMQGTSWNNIQYKSLTSEYVDYIQFYRKNKDLGEERKDKIKTQIAKGKNNTREIFVLDYEVWMKAESAGAIRLNKVVREILAMYCPFNKSIRTELESQPAFAEALQRFQRETAKKVKETELRYHALMKQGIDLTKPLEDTLMFYRDK